MKNLLVWGSQSALASAKVKALQKAFADAGFEFKSASSPMQLSSVEAKEFSIALLVVDSSMPPMADMWSKYFESAKEQISFFSWTQKPVPPVFKKHFNFKNSWSHKDFKDAQQLVGVVLESLEAVEAGNTSAGNPDDEKTFVEPAASKDGDFEESVTGILSISEPQLGDLGIQKETEDSAVIGDAKFESSIQKEANQESAISIAGDFDFAQNEALKEDEGLSLNVSSDHDDLSLKVESEESIDHSVNTKAPGSLSEISPSENKPDTGVVESLNVSVQSDYSASSRSVLPESIDALESNGDDSESFNVVKRYALLKEKENREKQKTIDILKSEISRYKNEWNKIQTDKRKLNLRIDEIESEKKALSETVDELRHRLNMSDSELEQKIKDYKVRLENSQYQEKKLEKKLDDFKLRVRLDIQSIRARERELENRLDLQKRDAEALLHSKDKRLLEQKSKIDKLEFEIETLKERLIEETEQAEERNGKLMRAVQSLKMAQGMLAGIDEEVIGAAPVATEDEEGDAA